MQVSCNTAFLQSFYGDWRTIYFLRVLHFHIWVTCHNVCRQSFAWGLSTKDIQSWAFMACMVSRFANVNICSMPEEYMHMFCVCINWHGVGKGKILLFMRMYAMQAILQYSNLQ